MWLLHDFFFFKHLSAFCGLHCLQFTFTWGQILSLPLCLFPPQVLLRPLVLVQQFPALDRPPWRAPFYQAYILYSQSSSIFSVVSCIWHNYGHHSSHHWKHSPPVKVPVSAQDTMSGPPCLLHHPSEPNSHILRLKAPITLSSNPGVTELSYKFMEYNILLVLY